MTLINTNDTTNLSFEDKVTLAQHRIEELYHSCGGMVYLSFSGGKDSTVLLALIKQCEDAMTIPPNSIPAVFSDTGIELEATKEFVLWVKENYYPNVEIIKPKMSFHEVQEKYGKPVLTKNKSNYLRTYHKNKDRKGKPFVKMHTGGTSPKSYAFKFMIEDYHILHPWFDIEVSNICCTKLKKDPLKKYAKDHNYKGYYLGERKAEGGSRRLLILDKEKNGERICIRKSAGSTVMLPIIDWSHDDVERYIKEYNVPLSRAYTEYNQQRTGCIGCPYGGHLSDSLPSIKQFEPNKYKAALFWFGEVYQAQQVDLPDEPEYQAQKQKVWDEKYDHMRLSMIRILSPHKFAIHFKRYKPITPEQYLTMFTKSLYHPLYAGLKKSGELDKIANDFAIGLFPFDKQQIQTLIQEAHIIMKTPVPLETWSQQVLEHKRHADRVYEEITRFKFRTLTQEYLDSL